MAGLIAYSPADIVRNLIVDLGHGTLPAASGSWPIFVDVEPDTPDDVITVFDTAGILQGRTQIGGEIQERYGFQVRIRGALGTATYVKANAILIGLDECYQDTVTISSDTYLVHSTSRTSGLLSLGRDGGNSRRIVYTFNATTQIRNT